MGMTIDKAIEFFDGLEGYTPQAKDARNVAVDTMRKYQKIQEIVEHWACCGNVTDSMMEISEVIEDGKID